MFAELLPILRNRPVMLTLALVGDNAIRVNVIPKRLKDSDSGDDALTTPLTVTGAPDELDREFAGQLVGFTDAFAKLGSKEIENKRKGSISKPSSTTTEAKPGPVVKDGKPVFGTKTGPAETASLFDSHGTAAVSGESQQERAASPDRQPVGAPQAEVAEPADESDPEVETAAARLPGL